MRGVVKLYPRKKYTVAEKGGKVYLYANDRLVAFMQPINDDHRQRIISRWLGKEDTDAEPDR